MMETMMEGMMTCREARSNEPAPDAGHATMEATTVNATAAATHASFGGRSRGHCTQEDDAGQRYHDRTQHRVSSFVAKKHELSGTQ
jgi:hypothetical protein